MIGKVIFKGIYFNEFVDDNNELLSFPVSFTMKVSFQGNSFQGTRIDDETKSVINEPVRVKGFLEGDFISFTIDYPCNYYIDPDTGQTILLEDEPHPGVVYEGFFDKTIQTYKGEYQVVIEELRKGVFQDDFDVEAIVGNWEMEKINN